MVLDIYGREHIQHMEEGQVNKKGGLLILTDLRLKASYVEMETGSAKNLAVEVTGKENRKMDVVIVYLSPKT